MDCLFSRQLLSHLSVSELNQYIKVKNTIGGEFMCEEMWLKLHRGNVRVDYITCYLTGVQI